MRCTRKSEGFTLVELLVVVLIVGILAAIAIPVYVGQQNSAEDVVARAELQQARIAMSGYLSRSDDVLPGALSDLHDLGLSDSVSTSLEHGFVPGAGVGQYCIEGEATTTNWFRVSESAGVEPGRC